MLEGRLPFAGCTERPRPPQSSSLGESREKRLGAGCVGKHGEGSHQQELSSERGQAREIAVASSYSPDVNYLSDLVMVMVDLVNTFHSQGSVISASWLFSHVNLKTIQAEGTILFPV